MIREEEDSSFFENRSDFIRFILHQAAENYDEMTRTEEKLGALKDSCVKEINEYWMDTVSKTVRENLESIGTTVELAVNKAIATTLAGLLAGSGGNVVGTVAKGISGGVFTGNAGVGGELKNNNVQENKIDTEKPKEPVMGVLPETEEDAELPDGALGFLDSL